MLEPVVEGNGWASSERYREYHVFNTCFSPTFPLVASCHCNRKKKRYNEFAV